MLRVIAVLVVIGVMVYAFVDCLRADARDLRLLPRPVWLLIVLVPLLGGLLYLALGRPLHVTEEPLVRPVAPDDDPEFLRRLDLERRRRQADEERRRRDRERRADRRPAKPDDVGGPSGSRPPDGSGRTGHEPGPEDEDHTEHPA